VDRLERSPPGEESADGKEHGERQGPPHGDVHGGGGDRLDQAEEGGRERRDPLRVAVGEDQQEGHRGQNEGEDVQEVGRDDEDDGIGRAEREGERR
jgi:hypothetical protein